MREPTDELRAIAADARRGAIRLTQRLRVERPPGALSANKIGVLGHLYRHGPSTPGEVAAAEFQLPQSMTRVFAELEAAELIVRTRSHTDRRESLLELTPVGQEVLTADIAARDDWLASAIAAALTETEAQVLRLAGILMDRIADATPPGGSQ